MTFSNRYNYFSLVIACLLTISASAQNPKVDDKLIQDYLKYEYEITARIAHVLTAQMGLQRDVVMMPEMKEYLFSSVYSSVRDSRGREQFQKLFEDMRRIQEMRSSSQKGEEIQKALNLLIIRICTDIYEFSECESVRTPGGSISFNGLMNAWADLSEKGKEYWAVQP